MKIVEVQAIPLSFEFQGVTLGTGTVRKRDVVVWYTFGVHHVVRPEDWPVMPAGHIGFQLKPVGFFNRNPALDLPPTADHCAPNGRNGASHH